MDIKIIQKWDKKWEIIKLSAVKHSKVWNLHRKVRVYPRKVRELSYKYLTAKCENAKCGTAKCGGYVYYDFSVKFREFGKDFKRYENTIQ